MPLKIVRIGRPVLRTGTRGISPARAGALKAFLGKMRLAMRRWKGVGLAANQVGKDLSLFVMENRENRRYPSRDDFPFQAYFNPRIVRYSKARDWDWEGCLSIPGYRGYVPRSREVVLEALDGEGKKVRKIFRGFKARVIQHETDHLNGLFYVDRMEGLSSWMHLDEFNRNFHSHIRDRK